MFSDPPKRSTPDDGGQLRLGLGPSPTKKQKVVVSSHPETREQFKKLSKDELLTYLETGQQVKFSDSFFASLKEMPYLNGQVFYDLGVSGGYESYFDFGHKPHFEAAKMKSILKTIHAMASRFQDSLKPRRADYLRRLQEIKAKNKTVEEYSTPGSVFQIPYPFLGNEVPGDRFLLSSDWETFKFVGRKEYASLHRMIMENLEPQIGVQGYKHIHLHGLLGWRKSHIACVLVTQLMAAGYRVIYAPDSKWVIADPWNYLRKSFYLAFADDEAALDMIDGCHSIDDLIRLSNTLAVKHGIEMVFVVDQVNAFGADSGDRTTEKLHQQLAQLTSEHISVQSSTGNFEIAGVALLAQEQVLKWSVYDGLDEGEMAKWWEDVIERYPRLQLGGNSEVSMKWKEKITWLSGSNPLLLRGVEEAFRAGEDSCAADLPTDTSIRQARLLEMIYDCKGWSDAIARIHTFANKVMSRSKRDKERYLKAIEGCLTRQQLDRSERDVLDSHYTYTDEQGIGRCGPGLVIQTLAGILWSVRKGLSIFLTSRWLEMIIHPGAYSSSLGFFVMTSSLAKLENKGIVINGTRYTGVETREYSGYPQLDDADREIKNRTYHHF